MGEPSESWKKLRERAKGRGMQIAELARILGVAVSSLRNLGSGWSSSKRLQRRLNDFFGEEIYPSVGLSGRVVRLPAGSEVEFETPDHALKFAQKFGASIVVRGTSICFPLPTRLTVQFPMELDSELASPAPRKTEEITT